MTRRIEEVVSDLAETATRARAEFGDLSPDQLNWKPAADRWSVGQCFDHLITTHELYFPIFERLAAGRAEPGLWERVSPLSGLFGRVLIRSLSPDNPRKSKTSPKAEPASSRVDGEIVARFEAHQADLIGHVRSLPADLDLRRTVVTSPLLGFVTYSLDDALTILVVHGQRHLEQARRVKEMEGFPG